jgi:hypothetical protein
MSRVGASHEHHSSVLLTVCLAFANGLHSFVDGAEQSHNMPSGTNEDETSDGQRRE